MNNNLKWIVYCTTNTINKKIYIGVHMTNPDYFDQYLGCGAYANRPSTYQHSKNLFHYALKKYGPDKFIRNTIAIFDNEEDAFDLEANIVTEEFLKRNDVYNMVLGGKIGGQVLQRIKVYQYDANGNFLKEHQSILRASIEINRNLRSIQRALKNKHKCCGFFWTTIKYDKLDLSKMHQYEGHSKIPVFQYGLDGNFECCYESIKKASEILGINSSNLSIAIKTGGICKNKYFTIVYSQKYSISRSKSIQSFEVHQYDLNGNYIASYSNMNQAKKALGITSNIYTAIKLKRTAGDFQWSFEKLNKMPPIYPKNGKSRPVGKFDKDWNLLEKYKSLAECKRANGSGMIHVLQGRDEFAKGFRYKYLD